MTAKTINKSFWLGAGGVLILALFLVPASQGQFDAAALQAEITALQTQMGAVMTTTTQMQSSMATSQLPALKSSFSTLSKISSFQDVLYDAKKIQGYWSYAMYLKQQMGTLHNMFNQPLNAASAGSLAGTLENQILSAKSSSIGSMATNYQNVYGKLPSSTIIPAATRQVVDMTDAHAQAALKRAITLDEQATQEEAVAQQMIDQLTSAQPGNTAVINAQLAAWNLQASAYTQGALAQLLRVESADTSFDAFQTKATASNFQNVITNAQPLLNLNKK